MENIISLNIYISDKLTEEEENAMNEEYCKIFADEATRPCRCCV